MEKVRVVLRAVFAVIVVVPFLIPAIVVIGIIEWLLSGKTAISLKGIGKGIYTFIARYEIDGTKL